MDYNRKFILVSSTCSEEEYDRTHIKDCYKIAQSAGKFYRLFCRGLVENGEHVTAYTVRPTGKMESGVDYLPAKKEIVDGIEYHYAKNVHKKILNRIVYFVDSLIWFLKSSNVSKNDIVILDPLRLSACAGAMLACKIRGVKTISYITDVPVCYAYGNDESPSIWAKLSYKLGKSSDMFIFITAQMNDIMNDEDKPYVVIEGFADERLKNRKINISEKYSNPVVMYAGGIEKIYGVDILVDGFLKASVPDSELHLYGDGSFVNEIKKISKDHPQIKYKGCKSNSVIVEEQMKVSLLVNPRYTKAEYTKYSFPSKNAEYIASGTATLTTKLPGIPAEYYPYVYLLDEESVDGMAVRLKEILGKDRQDLVEFGKNSKSWILENKNSKKQALKFIKFLSKNIEM